MTSTIKRKNKTPLKGKTTVNKKADRNKKSELLLPQELQMLKEFVNAQHIKSDAVELLGLVNRGTLRTTLKMGSCSTGTLKKIRIALNITDAMVEEWRAS
jgi:hypothetical protein